MDANSETNDAQPSQNTMLYSYKEGGQSARRERTLRELGAPDSHHSRPKRSYRKTRQARQLRTLGVGLPTMMCSRSCGMVLLPLATKLLLRLSPLGVHFILVYLF